LVGRLYGIRTQNGQNNWEDCEPYPVFASYTLAFALQLRKKHGKPSVRVAAAVGKLALKNPTIFTVSVLCVSCVDSRGDSCSDENSLSSSWRELTASNQEA